MDWKSDLETITSLYQTSFEEDCRWFEESLYRLLRHRPDIDEMTKHRMIRQFNEYKVETLAAFRIKIEQLEGMMDEFSE